MQNSKKRTIRLVCAILAALTMLVFAACSNGGGSTGGAKVPNGTYVAKGIIDQKFTFDGNNVTFSAFGINATGTYVLENGNIKITYTILGVSATFEKSFSRSGNVITIGGTEFTKE